MSKSEATRQRIFDIYSNNLADYLSEINYLPPEKIALVRGNIYFCPLCYMPFRKDQIAVTDSNFLTLEHNPPASVGGNSKILTCRDCNNANGAKLDHLVKELLESESFLYSENSHPYKTRIRIEDKSIGAFLTKIGGTVHVKPVEKSNPHTYRILQEKLKNRLRFNGDLQLKMTDWREYSYAILKMAYLYAFEKFGYNFADFGNGIDMRMALKREVEYPCPNNGVIDVFADDEMVGISIIREPKELQALVVTQTLLLKVRNKEIKKNIPVILPAPIQGGWEKLQNFKAYFVEQATMNLKLEKIGVIDPPLKDIKSFHGLFME
jgi:hypothetical protein